MRRWPRLAAVVAALSVLAAGAGVLVPRAARRPNVVIVLVDTLRADHLPAYGYGRDTAPFLSRLAQSGVVFDSAQATSAWTAPSTASLFTSLYPFQHQVVTGYFATERARETGLDIELNRIPDDAETLPEAMKAAGYSTFAVTGNVNIKARMGFAQGFDRFKNYERDEPGEVLTRKVLDWKPRMLASQPYFLYVHYLDPHAPYREIDPWFEASTDPDQRRMNAYDSEIRYIDGQVEALFRAMRWDRDTIFIFTADHGEEFGDHGGRGHGQTLFSEMVRIPLIAYGPRWIKGGRRIAEPVGHVDVLPTLREIGGLPVNPSHEGLSLWPLLHGEERGPGRRPFFHHLLRKDRGGRLVHGAVQGQWKFIEEVPGRRMLFDLGRDPREREDRSATDAPVAERLEGALVKFVKGSRKFEASPERISLDAEAVERLRALGYVH